MNIKNLFYTDSLIVRFLIWENWRYLFFLTGYYTYSTAQNKFHLIFSAYFRSFVSIYLAIVQIFKYKKCSSYKFFIELFSHLNLYFLDVIVRVHLIISVGLFYYFITITTFKFCWFIYQNPFEYKVCLSFYFSFLKV